MVWKPRDIFYFVTVNALPSWLGDAYTVDEKCKLGDKEEVSYKTKKLYASWYFLGQDIILHSYEVQDIVAVWSSFVAIAATIYSTIGHLGRYINSKIIIAKIV